VARSPRICAYVRGLVDGTKPAKGTTYSTFPKLLQALEFRLSSSSSEPSWVVSSNKSLRVDFGKFKREAFKSDFGLDVLVIWSQIRSFIKGSIEAVQAGRPLTQEEYLGLGENRCRLPREQRQTAYAAYEQYQQYLSHGRLWDDCDRLAVLLRKIQAADYEVREEIAFHKVYVDEIQDYTQAEIALFFKLCDKGGLFFAGDNAQSVVEGVEFRFEEVRSVGHTLFQGDKRFIPDKPMTVNMNFRSHSGILDVAAAILNRMFQVFPRSANKLDPDYGVFLGPRPGVFHNISLGRLQELVSRIDGVVLLTHDNEGVKKLQKGLAKAPLILGIRESKGLEFSDVIIVDFFRGLAPEHQKPW
jgi:superfamily I DNA/RNA helicase